MVWAMVMSFIVFAALKYTLGLRVTEEEEVGGLICLSTDKLLIQVKEQENKV